MQSKEKAVEESSDSPSGRQPAEQSGTMSCPMCGGSGTGKSPMETMMAKGPMAMMQKMPAMCMAFMVVTPALLGVVVGLMIGHTNARSR